MPLHHFERVRHELKRRALTVAAVERLTPRMVRVAFASPDLADFSSLAPDDHIKLFFPGPDGSMARRDFTPRGFDTALGALSVDFALHEFGPASDWASKASVGDRLDVAGPRSSTIVPQDFDWCLLIGDETALPAMARRLEELQAGARATSYAIVQNSLEVMSFTSAAELDQTWLVRDGRGDAAQLRSALAAFYAPSGDGFVWIAAEGGVARSLRQYMVEDRGHPREWIKAAGYWARGISDGGGRIED